MLTEEQVLQKLASYKDAIIKIKNDRDKAKADYADLKDKTYHTIKHLVEDNIEVKEKEILELKDSVADMDSRREQVIIERDKIYEDLQASRTELESLKQHLIKDEESCTKADDELKSVKERLEEKEASYDELHSKFMELQTFCNTVQEELKKVESQNGIYKSDISKLQKQLENIQQQSQQTLYNERAAKENFMNEISRVINEASEVLE